MNSKLLLATSAIVVSLTGCSTTIKLSKLVEDPARQVALRDSRSAEEKVYRRDRALQYFGDEDFDVPPLMHFALLLGSKLPEGNHVLEVNKFRVVDIFPRRLGATTAGALTGALGSIGYAVFFPNASYANQDNITCLISGTIDSNAISFSASVPYKISPLAGMVKNDPAFKSAANECLSLLADKVAKSP
jgi:hypothetical protein